MDNVIIRRYRTKRVPNPNPRGSTSGNQFWKARERLMEVFQRHGVTQPDYLNRTNNSKTCEIYLCDDQYNDDMYHYVEIYRREIATEELVKDVMAALSKLKGWGVGIKNIRFGYMLIFADRVLISGHPFDGCRNLASVVKALSANLWGINGETDPYVNNEYHREELSKAPNCGCFYCCRTFSFSKILRWKHRDSDGIGQTAICPYCGKAKVIAPKPCQKLSPKDLQRVSVLAFGPVSNRLR